MKRPSLRQKKALIDAIKASEWNTVVSFVNALGKSHGNNSMMTATGMLQRRILSSGSSPSSQTKIFKINDYTNYDGWYKCYEQKIASFMSDNSPFSNLNTTEVYVYNAAEESLTGFGLAVGDFIIAHEVLDVNGDSVWIGQSPKYAWWHD